MRRGQQLFSLALPALALCSGCLSEVGAKCNTDSNCPNGQYCADGSCALGSSPDAGTADGGIDAGINAGPQAPLAGTVTLNGGYPEPSGNTAWVLAWDHVPAISDAGVEDPQLIAQTSDGGPYAFWDAGVGTTYYLGVDYSIDGTGSLDDPTNRLDLFVNPQEAGAAGCDSVTLDAQTSACIAWSIFDGDTSTTTIVALIADIPDVLTGAELPSSSVKSAEATDPNDNSYGLSQVLGTGISDLDGKYAWTPSGLGTTPTAEAGNYHFDIDADGYPHGTCDVQHQPLAQAPVITSVPSPWLSAVANQVSWTSAPGTEFDSIEVDTINSDGTEGPEQYDNSNVTSPFSIPAGSCPIGKCRVIVTSTHIVDEGVRAQSLASSDSSDVVIGT